MASTEQDAITLAMLEFEPMATHFVRSGCTMKQDAINAAMLEFDSMVTHLVSASTQPDSSKVSKRPWRSEGPWKHAVHPLSLRGLIRKHGQVLYAEPLAWTELHLELLSCSFSFSDCDKTYLDPEDPPRLVRPLVRMVCELPKVQQLLFATIELEGRLPISDRAFTLQRILQQFDMRPRNKIVCDYRSTNKPQGRLPLRFGGNKPTELQAWQFLFAKDHQTPNTAIIEHWHLRKLRNNTFRGDSTYKKLYEQRPSLFHEIRQNALSHEQGDINDPYIVALLITLAQGQYHNELIVMEDRLRKGTQFALSPSFDAYVLSFVAGFGRVVYVYKATFTVDFLENFRDPSSYVKHDPITITCKGFPMMKPEELLKGLHTIFCSGTCSFCRRHQKTGKSMLDELEEGVVFPERPEPVAGSSDSSLGSFWDESDPDEDEDTSEDETSEDEDALSTHDKAEEDDSDEDTSEDEDALSTHDKTKEDDSDDSDSTTESDNGSG